MKILLKILKTISWSCKQCDEYGIDITQSTCPKCGASR